MFTADEFRAKAAQCTELLRNTIIPSEIRKHQRSKESFSLLARNEDWLADNFDKIIRSRDDRIGADGTRSRRKGRRQQDDR